MDMLQLNIHECSFASQFGVAHRTNAPPFKEAFDVMEQEVDCTT